MHMMGQKAMIKMAKNALGKISSGPVLILLGLAILPLALCLVGSDAAMAASGHGDELGADHAKQGLPQLDIASFPSQVFWLFVFFLIMYVAFARSILPVISATVQNRSLHIRNDREMAKELAQEAEEAQKSYETRLSEARDQAVSIHREVEKEIDVVARRKWDDVMAQARREEDKLTAELTKAKDKALLEMNDIAAEIAQDAAHKIIGVNIGLDAAKSAVESCVQSLGKDNVKKGKAA